MGEKEKTYFRVNPANPFIRKLTEASEAYETEFFNTKKRPLEKVQGELVSVIILSRNEELLSKTINNMSSMATGKIEFIVVLDGDYQEEFSIDINETLHNSHSVQFICNKEPLGRRPATNQAVERARGKFLFHLDAHCKTDVQGWDTLLKQSVTTPSTMVIPSLDRLLLPEFNCQGKRFGHKYIGRNFKDHWSGKKPVHNLEPTITGNGMGWFLTKEFYDSMGGCDTSSPAHVWGNFGIEWALKVWLSDYGLGAGQVLLSREVVFAHYWQKKLPYKQPKVSEDRNRLKEMYLSGKAPNQVRPFSFFEENLSHIFPKKWKDEGKEPLRVLQEATEPPVTVLMNTNGFHPELIEEAVESFLRQDYPNKLLKIISTNKHLQLDKDYENIELIHIAPFERFPSQIQYALKQVTTPYWSIMDSDDIFSSDHLSNLMKEMLKAKKEGLQSPCYVGIDRAIEHWVNLGTPKLRNRGWWSCLYERVPDELIDEAFEKFLAKKKKDTGSDLHFIKQDFWNKKYVSGKATAYHRLGVGFHIRNEHKDNEHYKNSLEQVKSYVPPVIVPQWKKDYDKMIHDFNYPSVTLLMKTYQRDLKALQEAINCFNAQDYPNKKLLIVNSHPRKLNHIGFNPNIKVVDVKPCNHLSHLRKSLGMIETEFFTIFDDDDLLKPNHISQLVTELQKNKMKPVINTTYIKFNTQKNQGKEEKYLMWWNGLYRTEDLKKYRVGHNLQGYDKKFIKAMAPTSFTGEPTYIWHRKNNNHESVTNQNSHSQKKKRISAAKKEAYAKKLDRLINVSVPLNNPPEITVVICTYGGHKEKTEEAIQSYIKQTYKHKKLLILNTHKDPIKLKEEFSDISVIELPEKKFKTLGEKHEYLINQVDTDYWTVLDDDDIILPWHLETLASALVHNRDTYTKKSNKRPLLSGHNRKIISVDNEYSYIKGGSGWTCRVFEKLTPEKVRAKLSKNVKGLSECNYDARFCSGKWHSLIMNYPVLPSYVWRGGGDSFHLSAAGDTSTVFNNAFETQEDKAQKIDNSSLWVPHWNKDYVQEFIDFLNTAHTKQIYGKNHHHLRLGTSGALRQEEFSFLDSFCKEHDVKKVVEFGSGASTLAFCLEGYEVISYETVKYWRDRVRLFLSFDPVRMWEGKAFTLTDDVDFILIDGPDPPETREESFKTAITSKAQFIASHDIFRDTEQGFIEKYFLQNGYKEVAKIEPTEGGKGLRGIGIYEKQ